MGHVSWENIINLLTLVMMASPLLHPLIFFTMMFGVPLVPSISSHRYYIMFVDDYTRVNWVYLLCNRCEVVNAITYFIMDVVTQYSTTPNILQPDNALDFVQTSLRTFCIPLVLTPRNKMVLLSENTISSLISLAHYLLRCMSPLTFGLTPS